MTFNEYVTSLTCFSFGISINLIFFFDFINLVMEVLDIKIAIETSNINL